MRIAVVSDIHGNRLALEAVLADLRSLTPDLVANLGDHLSGPLEAAATAELLLAQPGWVHILGNHDRQLVEREPGALGLSDRAAEKQLNDVHKSWLRSLPRTAVVAKEVLLCHGAPRDDCAYLLEEVSPSGVGLASREKIRSRAGLAMGAILCGHSHVPRCVRLSDGTLVLNPGSVGLQAYFDSEHAVPHVIETGSPHARYALLDRNSRGWRATFRVVEYAWDRAAQLAAQGNRPDWAHALATGYALRGTLDCPVALNADR
ncbi:MAG: metallophosphoesterase family protein [Acidobacteria bacterium]|nr:metallophosphoesterase family protein [Acidobacteriota bacterium]